VLKQPQALRDWFDDMRVDLIKLTAYHFY